MLIKNRKEAAEKLAEKLLKYKDDDGIVMAIPRGGVPVGHEISERLNWPLEIVLSKKIGHPTNKEYAIGAVSLTGRIVNNEIPVSEDYIDTETKNIRNELLNKYHKYMHDQEPLSITGKTVILTDDGVATGHTLLSTIDLLKRDKPAKIVVAIPVSSPGAMRKIEERVDEAICLACPENFRSVGQFYQTFDQVTDQEAIAQLHDRRSFKES